MQDADDWHDESGAALAAPAPKGRRRRALRAAALGAVLLAAAGGVGAAWLHAAGPAPAVAAIDQEAARGDLLRHLSEDAAANVLPPGRRDRLVAVIRMGPRTATMLFEARGGIELRFASAAKVSVVRDVPEGGSQWVRLVPKGADAGGERLDVHVTRGAAVPS